MYLCHGELNQRELGTKKDKIMIKFLLTLLLPLFCLTLAGQNNQTIKTLLGDTNGDGLVNVTDIVEFVNYFNDRPSSYFIENCADVNCDGIINREDVAGITNIIMASPHGKRDYMIIRLKNGTNIPYPLIEEPKITFTETELVITLKSKQVIYVLEDISRLTYSSNNDVKKSIF
jgi:hypothetical protein